MNNDTLNFKPIKRNLWTDLEELFGLNGACGGCWCMYWKLRGKAFEQAKGFGTRQMHKSLVDAGTVTGLLAYQDGEVVGWVAVEPRSAYERLAHSRTLQPLDDEPVWSVTCFFVAKKYRRQGIAVGLLKAAVEHVRHQGGKIVEGYPLEVKAKTAPAFIFTGTPSVFRAAGFVEVARRTPTRPIFRFLIEDAHGVS
jgi:GNAT superfamily N-acetyltransferase